MRPAIPLPLLQLRITPDQVRRQVAIAEREAEANRPLSPEEVRIAAARRMPKGSDKGSFGRRGLPPEVIETMYREYLSGKSLEDVGDMFGGRSRQAIYDLFKTHGKELRHKKYFEKIVWRGRTFTPGKDGYWRETSGDRKALHYAMWEAAHGRVPAGYVLTFQDGNRNNVKLANLTCAPKLKVMAKTRVGHNQFTPAKDRTAPRMLRPKSDTPIAIKKVIPDEIEVPSLASAAPQLRRIAV